VVLLRLRCAAVLCQVLWKHEASNAARAWPCNAPCDVVGFVVMFCCGVVQGASPVPCVARSGVELLAIRVHWAARPADLKIAKPPSTQGKSKWGRPIM
jgi:hypothetical protein